MRHCGACRRELAPVQGTRRLQRVRLFPLRLYCTGLGFQANIVEEYVLLSALLHIFAGLKRTRDQKLSSGLMSGQLSLAIIGLMLLMFMTIHLFQLRFADTEQYFLRHLFFVVRGSQRTSTVVQPLVPRYWPRYQ